MKPRFLPLSFFLLLVTGAFCFAQPVGSGSDASAEARDFSNPYVTGETITYVGKYRKLGFAWSIAEIEFSVLRDEDGKDYFLTSEARSRGTLAKLFNFKFYQKIDSTIDGQTLQIKKSVKRDEQGDRVRDSEADFDYGIKKVMWTETDPNDPARAPKRVASTITDYTQDVVSAVYVLRGKEIAVGRSFVFKISDSGLVYDVPVTVTGREMVNTEIGKLWCWKIEAEIFGEGRLIDQEGSFTLWVTDDDRRIPVLADLNTEKGDVDIKIEEYSVSTLQKDSK